MVEWNATMGDKNGIRIAMWSGPRNISTALLRSWGNRDDTFVCDEPLYAHYLRETGTEHPGRDEVLSSQENDWEKVVDWLTGDIPEGKAVFYQKHMAHHLLPGMGYTWLDKLSNTFLIRDPREMITSLIRVTPNPGVADTGLPQQWALFKHVRETSGQTPPVIDSRDVLEKPRALLTALCDALRVAFTEDMLSWPAGTRDTDGVWSKHWYAAVEKSTGFSEYNPRTDPVPDELRDVHEQCQVWYDKLYAFRLTP